MIIDCCHSGNLIGKGKAQLEQALRDFKAAFIDAFVSVGKSNLRTGDYYVLTASAGAESSWGNDYTGGVFTRYLCSGSGYSVWTRSFNWNLFADSNSDRKLSLDELHRYAYTKARNEFTPAVQTAQVWPTNSSFVVYGWNDAW